MITVIDGNSGNTINAAILSPAHSVTIVGGAGTDVLTGGAGNDVFRFSTANLSNSDTINGGGGGNLLIMSNAGTVNASGVSGVEAIHLGNSGANNLTLKNANFTGTSGMIWVYGRNGGNTVNASQVTAASDRAIFSGGAGADHFTGGAGNDVFYAGGDTTMTGGAGANRFTFADIGTNGITDFAASAGNELVVRKSGFNLGTDESLANGTMQHFAASVFVANSTGTFTNAGQRFAYNTKTGGLSYSASGSGSGSAVVVLAGAPTLAAGLTGHVFFTL